MTTDSGSSPVAVEQSTSSVEDAEKSIGLDKVQPEPAPPPVEVPRSERRGLFGRITFIPEVVEPKHYVRSTKYFITVVIALAGIAAPLGSAIIFRKSSLGSACTVIDLAFSITFGNSQGFQCQPISDKLLRWILHAFHVHISTVVVFLFRSLRPKKYLRRFLHFISHIQYPGCSICQHHDVHHHENTWWRSGCKCAGGGGRNDSGYLGGQRKREGYGLILPRTIDGTVFGTDHRRRLSSWPRMAKYFVGSGDIRWSHAFLVNVCFA